MDEPKLEALVRAAREGGREEMDAFLRALRPLTCRWALVWSGSPDTAEDVAQRVLMKVSESIRTYAGSGKVTTWAYRVTRNALIDLERERGKHRRLRDRLALERLAKGTAEREGTDPLARILLGRLMEDLSPRQRAVLDLVDLQGFEPREVAEMLELAPETVRVHLHRARTALRAGATRRRRR